MLKLLTVLVLAGAASGADSVHCFRVVLDSPGGQLPFGLEIRGSDGDHTAVILNGPERIPVGRVEFDDTRLILGFDHYASEIRTNREGADRYEGKWTKRSPGKTSELRVSVEPVRTKWEFVSRFRNANTGRTRDPSRVVGDWAVTFLGSSGDDPSPGGARFSLDGQRVLGTFFTPVGDYRYLEGDVRGDELRLSCFDGAHAFLFRAKIQSDGTLKGDFWSRDSWHETWTAKRLPDGVSAASALPDPFELTSLKPGQKLDFRFPDLDGRPVSLNDSRFAGKPVLVEIFGSWCPNCHDAAPVLREFRRRYGDLGLTILGLAYEITGDPELDAEQVRRYAERHGCDWTILLAGTSNKAEASKTLPSLSGVKSYPTTIFIDREGKVRKIYTGFSGPATGPEHEKLLQEWDEIIREIVFSSSARPASKTPPTSTGRKSR